MADKTKKLKFSPEIQRAWEEGRKSQTRRIIEPQPKWFDNSSWTMGGGISFAGKCALSKLAMRHPTPEQLDKIFPYGKVGDTIPLYTADDKIFDHAIIENVRVEKVQEIVTHDCIAEGLLPSCEEHHIASAIEGSDAGDDEIKERFADLWDSIYGHGAWERNDLVWVIGLKKA